MRIAQSMPAAAPFLTRMVRFLGALAAATNARRILELGTGLGYTALWFAHGAPDAVIDTVERDAGMSSSRARNVTQFNLDGHIVVHQSDFAKVLPRLDPGYDIVFFDGYRADAENPQADHGASENTRAPDQRQPNLGGKDTEAYRAAIIDPENWLTAFIGPEQETALSVKLCMARPIAREARLAVMACSNPAPYIGSRKSRPRPAAAAGCRLSCRRHGRRAARRRIAPRFSASRTGRSGTEAWAGRAG